MSQESQLFVPKISPKLQEVLEQIATDVVELIGCVGAMVTTLESGSLVVRAYALIHDLAEFEAAAPEANVRQLQPGAVFPLHDTAFRNNLAVRAMSGENGRAYSLFTSPHLSDLFSPYISQPHAERLQQAAGIQQVAVLPFLLQGEVIGSLFVASPEPLTERTINFLNAFGRQAAIAIQNQRRLEAVQALERITLRLQARMTDENDVLQYIADAVVAEMGYVAALVATLEDGQALPVRAYAVAVDLAEIQAIERGAGIRLLSEEAVVHLDDERCQDNLSVRAVKGLNGRPENYLIADNLYDLLRPLVSTAVAEQAQALLGVRQVIAVPFFQADQVVGNLFVASQKAHFSTWEISLLTALGQQAAVGLHNARLYQAMAQQRHIAQTFGRMAFSTIASAHALRNHVGNVNGYLQIQQMLPNFPPERREMVYRELPAVLAEIGKAIHILDNLNSPWRQGQSELIDVHDALYHALTETFPRTPLFREQKLVYTDTDIRVHLNFSSAASLVRTAKDMLAEAFRIILKNAVEAVQATAVPPTAHEANIWLQTKRTGTHTLEVRIRDNGAGILPKHLPHIFELGWSTKKGSGMGFGLFWARDYIEGLGGKITVHSTPGEDTTFTVVLPVQGDDASVENPTDSTTVSP